MTQPQTILDDADEIIFWNKAKKLIQKGFGKDICSELHGDCVSCRAQMMIAWINSHLELIEDGGDA